MITILVVPLSKITAIDPELNETFFNTILKDIPQLGKVNNTHYILNNNLTINNPANLGFIKKFNLLLQFSKLKGQLIQITKN